MAKTKPNPWLEYAPGGSQWPGTVWQPQSPDRLVAFGGAGVPALPELAAMSADAPPAPPAPATPTPAAPAPAAPGMPFPQGVQQGANVGSTSWPGLSQHWQYVMSTAPASDGNTAKTGNELLSYLMQGHDWKNLSTRGMSGSGKAFKFGKVSYDPSKDTGRAYQGMSGKGRITHRGAAWNVFVYRFNQLMAQRDRGGNPDRGVRPDMTDEEIAELAARFVMQKNTGSTGFSIG